MKSGALKTAQVTNIVRFTSGEKKTFSSVDIKLKMTKASELKLASFIMRRSHVLPFALFYR